MREGAWEGDRKSVTGRENIISREKGREGKSFVERKFSKR